MKKYTFNLNLFDSKTFQRWEETVSNHNYTQVLALVQVVSDFDDCVHVEKVELVADEN